MTQNAKKTTATARPIQVSADAIPTRTATATANETGAIVICSVRIASDRAAQKKTADAVRAAEDGFDSVRRDRQLHRHGRGRLASRAGRGRPLNKGGFHFGNLPCSAFSSRLKRFAFPGGGNCRESNPPRMSPDLTDLRSFACHEMTTALSRGDPHPPPCDDGPLRRVTVYPSAV